MPKSLQMSDNNDTESLSPGSRRQITTCLKTYKKPAIISKETLEVLANTCSPASGGKDTVPLLNCVNFASS